MNVGIFIATLSSASVEFFETAAIAYAILRSGYPREAIWGTMVGLILVVIASVALGAQLQLIPVRTLQIAIGISLLWFGWGWYKKSVLRQARRKRAGWVSTNPLEAEGIAINTQHQGFNRLNFIIMIKSAALEALEVALVVITLGLASQAWDSALLGAAVALVLTIAVVAILHGYLLKVPDVLLKLGAGVMLLSYGTFWLGEGLGFNWWFGELGLVILIGFYTLTAVVAIRWLERQLH